MTTAAAVFADLQKTLVFREPVVSEESDEEDFWSDKDLFWNWYLLLNFPDSLFNPEEYRFLAMTSVRERIQRHLIRRRKKLTILLRAEPVSETSTSKPPSPACDTADHPTNITDDTPADAGIIYDTSSFVNVCATYWSIWQAEAEEERVRAMELAIQYPTPTNLGTMMDLEHVCKNMEKVVSFNIKYVSSY